MTRSLAAIFEGIAGKVSLRRLEVPAPGPGEYLVRVLGCTICGSDRHTFEGRRATPTPTVLGHEIVGRVEAIGAGAPERDLAENPLRVGDRVVWAIVASCGRCFYCQRDLPQKCQHAVKYGHEAFRPGRELLGGLAEHCLLAPGTAVMKLPDLPLSVACPASCATATVAAAIEAAGVISQRTVCVFGAGMLGLTACAMARERGAAEVMCVEPHPGRRQLAARFGASCAINPTEFESRMERSPDANGVDVAFEMSGVPAAFDLAWRWSRIGGTVVLVGAVFPAAPVPIALEQLVRRHLTLRGIHNYGPRHLRQAVEFLDRSHERYPFSELVAQWMPLTEIDRAFERAGDLDAIRVGVAPTA